MPQTVIKIYFDYVCPYCWIAHQNASRLASKYQNISFEWKPWEILPEAPVEGIRLEFDSVNPLLAKLAEEAGLWLRVPSVQPNSHWSLLGTFYAKENGRFEEYNDAVFNSLWNEDENIGSLEALSMAARKARLDPEEFKRSLKNHQDRYNRMLEESEREASSDKVELVPAFVFGKQQIIGNISAKKIEKFIKHVISGGERA